MTSPKETTIQTRTVDNRTVEIVRLDWPDGGVLYDAYQQTTDGMELLTTDESVDHIPSDQEIRDLLDTAAETPNDATLTHTVADVLDGTARAQLDRQATPVERVHVVMASKDGGSAVLHIEAASLGMAVDEARAQGTRFGLDRVLGAVVGGSGWSLLAPEAGRPS